MPEYLAAYLNASVGLAFSNRGVTGGTRIAIDYGIIRALEVPVPAMSLQKKIVAEIHHRREQARRLRNEVGSDWAEAKRRFEEQLLGT
ncbi:MAG: type restriction enzyme subunit [Verrucomicrobiota bacterium]